MKIVIVLLLFILKLECMYSKFLDKNKRMKDDRTLDLKGIVEENGLVYNDYKV